MTHPPTSPQPPEAPNAQKQRSGLKRIVHAAGYWHETAFRQEALLSFFLFPASFWLGNNWLEVAVLAGVVVLVLVTELLNSGIEAAIDRIGPEWHDLSKQAKDMGSAAVLLSLLLCGGTWAGAIWTLLKAQA